MELKEALPFFSKISEDFPVELLARPGKPLRNPASIKSSMQIFDALELLKAHDCLVTEKGLIVTRSNAMERPVRALFFALIIEVEYTLYKILKQYADSPESLERLRSSFLNELIKGFFLDPGPFEMQSVYAKKQEMKRDMKAVSAFRNIIMHSNRKIELETEFSTILKRKEQLLRLLEALNQVAGALKKERGAWI
jgi:hypothetical protein